MSGAKLNSKEGPESGHKYILAFRLPLAPFSLSNIFAESESRGAYRWVLPHWNLKFHQGARGGGGVRVPNVGTHITLAETNCFGTVFDLPTQKRGNTVHSTLKPTDFSQNDPPPLLNLQ